MDRNEPLLTLAADPCTPYWVRDLIHAGLSKDPTDAAGALQKLSQMFNDRESLISMDAFAERKAQEESCEAGTCGHYTCTEGGSLGYWEGADPRLEGNF